jgi:NAD(P)-dependent dehydrogenase (short-subunit alcohol dehydrogenase family)
METDNRPTTGIREFDGRVAVVTGGASGIGRGIATALVAAGATVVLADRDTSLAEATGKEIGALNCTVDVTDPNAMEQLAQELYAEFGRIDILVNNAGVGPLDTFDGFSLDDFRWVMDINFWGVVHGTKSFLPLLKINPDGGYIVNTASMAALLPSAGITAYGASKAAVLALSESLAAELDNSARVGVAVLLPALVDTNINANALARPGQQQGSATEDFLPPGTVLDADTVGDMVVEGIRNGSRYIFTHPETRGAVAFHQAELVAAYDAVDREARTP